MGLRSIVLIILCYTVITTSSATENNALSVSEILTAAMILPKIAAQYAFYPKHHQLLEASITFIEQRSSSEVDLASKLKISNLIIQGIKPTETWSWYPGVSLEVIPLSQLPQMMADNCLKEFDQCIEKERYLGEGVYKSCKWHLEQAARAFRLQTLFNTADKK